MKKALTAAAILILLSCNALADIGSLTSLNGSIEGTGFWVTGHTDSPPKTPSTITWEVSRNADSSYRYSYVLEVPQAAISHFILQTCSNFTIDSMFDFEITSGSYGGFEIKTHNTGGGNPYMPDDMYGIKLDDTSGTTLAFAFSSWYMPEWGNFYAKCGAVGGTQNTAWNSGFDLTTSSNEFILTPGCNVVPTPGSLALLLAGLPGIVLYSRHKPKKMSAR